MAVVGSQLINANAGNNALQESNALSSLARLHLMNQMQGMKNQYYQQTMPSSITVTNAQNEANAQFAEPLLRARLEIANNQAPLLAAQTAHTNEITKLAPEITRIQRANAITKAGTLQNSINRFTTPLYTVARWLQTAPEPVRAKFIQENPDVWTQITQQGLYQVGNPQNNNNLYADSALNALGVVAPKTPKPQQIKMPWDNASVANTPVQNQPQMTSGGNSLTLNKQTPNAVGNAAQNAYIKSIVPAPIQQQRYYANIAGNIYNQTKPLMPSVAKFSGYGGTLDKLMNSLQSGANGNPSPDYTNLLKFKQNVVLLGNELRRTMGGQATDNEAKLLKSVTEANLATKTPAQVLALYQNLGQLLNTVSGSIRPDQAAIQKNLGNEANVKTTSSNFKIPSFANKAEFQKWYGAQNASVQAQVRAQLGG